MDEQRQNSVPNEPKPPMTAEEIARAEAEAVAAMLRGEAPTPSDPTVARVEKPVRADFVPYVDDVVDPKPVDAPAAPAEAPPEEDDEPYIPGAMEQRIDALTDQQWKLWQGIGGAVLGLGSVLALVLFNGELSTYGLVVAALLVLALPRYLERAWNHKMPFARRIMLIAMVVALVASFVITGLRHGFVFTNPN